jgi:hypothetical protein
MADSHARDEVDHFRPELLDGQGVGTAAQYVP